MDIVNKSVIHHAYTESQHSLFQRFSISKSEIVRDVIDISKKTFPNATKTSRLQILSERYKKVDDLGSCLKGKYTCSHQASRYVYVHTSLKS